MDSAIHLLALIPIAIPLIVALLALVFGFLFSKSKILTFLIGVLVAAGIQSIISEIFLKLASSTSTLEFRPDLTAAENIRRLMHASLFDAAWISVITVVIGLYFLWWASKRTDQHESVPNPFQRTASPPLN